MVKNVCFVSNYDVKSAKRGTKTESEVLVGGGEKRAKKLVQFACLQERISAERRLNVFVCANLQIAIALKEIFYGIFVTMCKSSKKSAKYQVKR